MCLCMSSILEFGGYFCLWCFFVGLILFVGFFFVVLVWFVVVLLTYLVWFSSLFLHYLHWQEGISVS